MSEPANPGGTATWGFVVEGRNKAGVSSAPLPVALAGEVRRLLVEALLADLKAHPTRPPCRTLPGATVGTAPGHARSQGDTSAELAERLHLSPKTLLKRKARGEIRPAVQRGKLIRWRTKTQPRR